MERGKGRRQMLLLLTQLPSVLLSINGVLRTDFVDYFNVLHAESFKLRK